MPLVGHAFAALAATLRKRLGAMVTLLGVAGLACGVQASNPLDPARAGQTGETSSASAAPVTQVAVPGKTTLPASMKIKYAVESNKFPFSATTDLLWRQNGETYEIQQESGTLGIAIQRSSRGHITPVGLAPLRFSYKILSELTAQVDREKNKVTFSANTPDAPLLAGAQDQLSIQVQLAAMLAGNPAHFSRGTALTIKSRWPPRIRLRVIAVIEYRNLYARRDCGHQDGRGTSPAANLCTSSWYASEVMDVEPRHRPLGICPPASAASVEPTGDLCRSKVACHRTATLKNRKFVKSALNISTPLPPALKID